MQTTLTIMGDRGLPYEITLIETDTKIKIGCSCPAGSKGDICKHRLRILAKEFDTVTKFEDEEIAMQILASSSLQQAAQTFKNETDKINTEIELLKKEQKNLKNNFAKALLAGI